MNGVVFNFHLGFVTRSVTRLTERRGLVVSFQHTLLQGCVPAWIVSVILTPEIHRNGLYADITFYP